MKCISNMSHLGTCASESFFTMTESSRGGQSMKNAGQIGICQIDKIKAFQTEEPARKKS